MKIIIFKTIYIFLFFSITLADWDGTFNYKTFLKTKLGAFQGEKIQYQYKIFSK